jgi:hypothetical protein
LERSVPQDRPADGSPGLESRVETAATDSVADWGPIWIGLGLALVCLVVYIVSQPNRSNPYLHFVLQAQSWLEGVTSIPTPHYQDVLPILDANGNPTGQGIIPFPPLPAWVLLPFVALWHLGTNEQLLACIFAAIDVGIAYWMLGRLPLRPGVRGLTALFLGLGSVLWYAAAIGTTWFWAHIVAVGCLLVAVGIALAADPDAAQPRPVREAVTAVRKVSWPGGWRSAGLLVAMGIGGELLFVLAGAGTPAASLAAVGVVLCVLAAALATAVVGRSGALAPFAVLVVVVGGLPALLIGGTQSPALLTVVDVVLGATVILFVALSRRRGGAVDAALAAFWRALSAPETMQVAAGIMFGLAVTARLTILLGFPFLILVGGGGTWLRRGMLAGAGAAVPLLTLLVLTYATSGHLFNPAYDYLYHLELGYPFGYHADWSITDVRYIPQNIGIMFFNQPWWLASQDSNGNAYCVTTTVRGLFDPHCPLAIPNPIGMSLILSSPAYLLAPLAWLPARLRTLDRATAGATIAVIGIAVVNLMHFSQGWVQFGYRFSNDFVPFALILIALGASRMGRLWPLVLLVAASVAINFWGTMWGVTLGW